MQSQYKTRPRSRPDSFVHQPDSRGPTLRPETRTRHRRVWDARDSSPSQRRLDHSSPPHARDALHGNRKRAPARERWTPKAISPADNSPLVRAHRSVRPPSTGDSRRVRIRVIGQESSVEGARACPFVEPAASRARNRLLLRGSNTGPRSGHDSIAPRCRDEERPPHQPVALNRRLARRAARA